MVHRQLQLQTKEHEIFAQITDEKMIKKQELQMVVGIVAISHV